MRKAIIAVAAAVFLVATSMLVTAQSKTDYAEREKTAPRATKQLLTRLRKNIRRQHLKFTVGYTWALENQVTGCAVAPTDMLAKARVQNQRSEETLRQNPRPRFDACFASAS